MTLREEFENDLRNSIYSSSSQVNPMYDISDSAYIIWLESKLNNMLF